jgi:O-antigen/teichoic acid export membrane protein
VISDSDVFLLRQLTSLELVGVYAAAQTIISVLKSTLVGIEFASAPVLANLFAARKADELQSFSRTSLRLSAWLSFFCIALLAVMAPPIMDHLFGEAFSAAASSLQLLVWALPFYGVHCIVGASILAAGGERPLVGINVLVMVLSVGLNIWLIPINPLLAVSGVAVVSYAVCAVLYLVLAAHLGVQPLALVRVYVRPALAAAGVALVVRLCIGPAQTLLESLGLALGPDWLPAIALDLAWLSLTALTGLGAYLLLLWLLGELDPGRLGGLRGLRRFSPGPEHGGNGADR